MKAHFIFMTVFFALGCRGQIYVEPGIGVGKYIVGATVTDSDLLPNNIDLKKERNTIVAIYLSDAKYRTKEGLGIGSSFDEVRKHFGHAKITNLPLHKGEHRIGTMGQGLFYEGIGFVDLMKDGVVDLIIIE